MANVTVKQNIKGHLTDLKQDLDGLFDHFLSRHLSTDGPSERLMAVIPPIETWIDSDDKEFHLTMALPGIQPEDIHVSLQGNRLVFSGEQKEQPVRAGKDYIEREISYGRFLRKVTLPDGIEGDKLSAELKDGILEIIVPISAGALSRTINVTAATRATATVK